MLMAQDCSSRVLKAVESGAKASLVSIVLLSNVGLQIRNLMTSHKHANTKPGIKLGEVEVPESHQWQHFQEWCLLGCYAVWLL
jgi:hypothetical protein